MTVYVCFDRDIECGDRPANWCATCPKRPAVEVPIELARAMEGPRAKPAHTVEVALMLDTLTTLLNAQRELPKDSLGGRKCAASIAKLEAWLEPLRRLPNPAHGAPKPPGHNPVA